ncbi:MAG TPA: enoyl-CoA hydratase/isomerase family protein [Xanthobacteraceae bacterium]|jgi:enoyl-CoA hydratase
MNQIIVEDGDVLVRELGALRRLTLNRPKALNALTLGMSETMTRYMQAWAGDPGVGAILVDGSGDRAFCAGGDLRALYDGAKAGSSVAAQFWSTEYKLDVLIARYPKPVIVIMDGLVMGGGVGLSAYAARRVVTERSAVALPEVGIGYFPDIGASYLLARAPDHFGYYLALTGSRIGPADAIECGLADVHIPAAKLGALPMALGECRSSAEVQKRLGEFAEPPAPGRLPTARRWIDHCYGAERVEDIVERLRGAGLPDADAALAIMQKASPTSLKITLRNLREAASFERVEESFQQDYRISLACIAGHDFIEGIRAAIVDKDRNPAWRPDSLEAVTPEIVDRHFQSVGKLELKF